MFEIEDIAQIQNLTNYRNTLIRALDIVETHIDKQDVSEELLGVI